MDERCHPRRRPSRRTRAAALAAVALVCAVSGCGPAAKAAGNGLFSWSDTVLEGEGRERLLERMALCELGVLYQYFSRDTDAETVRSFLRAAEEAEIAVYLLTGEPDWGLDPSGAEMAAEVARCTEYNRGLGAGTRLRGVMMDAEPYLTEAWEADPAGTMDAYVSAMAAARGAAREAGLQYAACIPWFYDTKGLEEELGELISSGCDALAVMNYLKQDEAAQIETEAALAREAGVPVTVIYELQPPGTHDLSERNTYYQDGLEAVAESFLALEADFGGLFYALHDEAALGEVLDRG